MKVWKLLGIAWLMVFFLLTPPTVFSGNKEMPVFLRYNIQGTSYTYGVLTGQIQPYGTSIGKITTSGSSATWTAVGADTPFAAVSIGDRIAAKSSGSATGAPAVFSRTVTAKASSISITVHAAANLQSACGAGGCAWTYKTYSPAPGTTATDGWINTDIGPHTVAIEVVTLGSTSIEYSIETRTYDGGPITILQGTFTSATFPDNGDVFAIGENVSELRVGLKRTGAGTNAVNVSLFEEEPVF
jgi:hypothetical protein